MFFFVHLEARDILAKLERGGYGLLDEDDEESANERTEVLVSWKNKGWTREERKVANLPK